MIPKSLKLNGRNITLSVESTDPKYLEWVESFAPRFAGSLDTLLGAARTYLVEQKLISGGDTPELQSIVFDGDDDRGWCYSLLFAAPHSLGVIFDGHRPVGIVHGAG